MATKILSETFNAVSGEGSDNKWVDNPLSGHDPDIHDGLDATDGEGGSAEWWMEGMHGPLGGFDRFGIPFGPSNRALCQSLINSYRNQWLFYLDSQAWATSNTYFLSAWRYLADTLVLTENGEWWELLGFDDGYLSSKPFVCASLGKEDDVEVLYLTWDNGTGGGDEISPPIPCTIPRNTWFQVGLWVNRGTVDAWDATAKIYINDILKVTDLSGHFLKSSANRDAGDHPAFGMAPMYSGNNAGYLQRTTTQWTDDIEIWDDYPTGGGGGGVGTSQALWDVGGWDLASWDDIAAALGYPTSLFSGLKTMLRQQLGIMDFSVTRLSYSLGTRDTWTGWRKKQWTQSIIDMVLLSKDPRRLNSIAGIYPIRDMAGITEESMRAGDIIKEKDGTPYRVETVKDIRFNTNLRECQMIAEPLFEADFSAPTWTKTRGSDSRYRTKVWLDPSLTPPGYLRTSQITKDDDSTLAAFAVMFSHPPYLLSDEFRAGTNPVQGLYVLEKTDVEALVDSMTRKNYAYNDKVVIHIITVDSLGCSGIALEQKMDAELRYVFENYPLGSVRSYDHEKPQVTDLGDMKLYDTLVTLAYKRDVTT